MYLTRNVDEQMFNLQFGLLLIQAHEDMRKKYSAFDRYRKIYYMRLVYLGQTWVGIAAWVNQELIDFEVDHKINSRILIGFITSTNSFQVIIVERPSLAPRVEQMRTFMTTKGYQLYANLTIDDVYIKSVNNLGVL